MTPKELQNCIDKNQRIIDESKDPAMVGQARRHIEQLRAELPPDDLVYKETDMAEPIAEVQKWD